MKHRLSTLFGTLLCLQAPQVSPAAAQSLFDKAQRLKPSAAMDCATPRIVGGAPTCINDWPWQIALYLAKQGRAEGPALQCGGSIVADRWILTAAHCVQASHDPKDYFVLEGETRAPLFLRQARKGAHVVRVARIIFHEGYHDTKFDGEKTENDIAVLELEAAARSRPVGLLTKPDAELEASGRSVDLTGFGQLRPTDNAGHDQETGKPLAMGQIIPERLMHVQLPLVDISECARDNNGQAGIVDTRTLCAGAPEGGKDTCQGDSGGPMTVKRGDGKYMQIGVVSWGVGCGKVGYPGIYTRVSAFSDWISAKVGRNLAIVPEASGAPTPSAPSSEAPGAPATAATFDNDAGVSVGLVQGDVVKVGQQIAFRATTRKPGYLVLLDITADGRMTQIFPNAASLRSPLGADVRANLVTPQRPLFVGDPARNKYEGFAYVVDPPKGDGAVVAVLSETPLASIGVPDSVKSYSKAESSAMLDRMLDELKATQTQGGEGGETPRWSVDIHRYTIQ